ncbi:MAG: general secretion pathway protein GspK [Bacteriovoracaceae bacterium]|nr:general secretion pathway protein GspK [Bacteriovoracaceae bacterium]
MTLKNIKRILNNNAGVAIMLVLTAITLLMAIMGDFTFETKINKIKSMNIQDQAQAQLMAEAGLNLTMLRLRLYKEAFNYLEKNKSAKDTVKITSVNQIWEVPFVFPIPVGSKMSAKQKAAIQKFMKNSLLDGEMAVSVSNISNMLNLNLLRVSMFLKKNSNTSQDGSEDDNEDDTPTPGTTTVETKPEDTYNEVVKLVSQSILMKNNTDPEFEERNAGTNALELISSIKFYISDPEAQYDDPFKATVENNYNNIKITPKHASMASMSELYLLAGWSDELLEILKNEVTVHGNVMIDLNKITDKVLRLIIPSIDDEEIREFFEYRDDPETPHPFNSELDFKNYITNIGRIMSAPDYDARKAEFDKANIKFGSAPTLFRVTSVGKYGRSTYTLEAYVSIPSKPEAPPKPVTPPPVDPNNPTPPPPGNQAQKAVQVTQLLEPRIVEIIIK